MGRGQKDEPYSSVISSGSTSPRKWPLKSSCRQEARTDSCSESKSSWVVRRGETVTTQTQPHCPHYPEPLNSSACGSRISRPSPSRRDPSRGGEGGVSCLRGSGLGCFLLTSRTWSTISCMTSHWASVSLQSRRGRKSQGHRGEQREGHTPSTLACTETKQRRSVGSLAVVGASGQNLLLPGQRPRRRGTPTAQLPLFYSEALLLRTLE